MWTASVWILCILRIYIKIFLAGAVDIDQEQSLVSVRSGEAVILDCTLADLLSNEDVLWYKQPLGQMLQEVGMMRVTMEAILYPHFQNSGIKLLRTANRISLTIPHTTKDDEGIYYCGTSEMKMISFYKGTFLAVTDDLQLNISVLQTPLQSVPPGEAVNLQCKVLSEIRSAELRVFWIRSAAGSSFPKIIYTHHNSSSSRQCEISVYNFSTNILHENDPGTYYCAVQTCGRIIIGNGTTVAIGTHNSLLVGMGLALCLSVIWNITLCFFCVRWRNGYEQCRGNKFHKDVTNPEGLQFQEPDDAVELNYAALNFAENESKRKRKKKSGRPQNSVYSEVRYTSQT